MDSLKISKTPSTSSSNNASSPSTNKSAAGQISNQTSVPITVRFNAGDECIDDIFQSFHTTNTTNTSATNTGGGGGGGGGGNSTITTNTNNTNMAGASGGGGADSLSTSPAQHHQHPINNPDEVTTRNNFLQGNFFHRKRSGSIEGISPTSVGPNLIAALSGGDVTSIGTWRMIKGKVSQTIEDIKSSKGSTTNITTLQPQSYPTIVIKGEDQQQQQQQAAGVEFDSDQETKTSLSEDLSVELDRRSSGGSTKRKKSSKMDDSDSEFENEIYLEADSEHSRFRRGFAHLKSKVKSKHVSHQAQKATLNTASAASSLTHANHTHVAAVKKDISPSRSTGSSSSSTSIRGNFLRRRRNKVVETVELASPTNMASALAAAVAASGDMTVVVSGKPSKKSKIETVFKKDLEIESGVEMLEDMIPAAVSALPTDNTSPCYTPQKRDELDLPLPADTTNSPCNEDYTLKTLNESNERNNMSPPMTHPPTDCNAFDLKSVVGDKIHSLCNYWCKTVKSGKYLPIFSIFGLLAIFILPINEFMRGVLCCLLAFTLVESLWNFIQNLIEHYSIHFKPEKTMFHIPDYSKMTICEVPAAKEYKTVKSYGGWMNQINSYDPNTFSINMARSVYVKLDGTIMRLSATNARIPKRVMWNELPINRKTIIFTTHCSFDLLGCRIELLPIGLARKRHFNRKYPIQLIIKDGKSLPSAEGTDVNSKPVKRLFHRYNNKCEKSEGRGELSDNNAKSNETDNSQAHDASGEIDFGHTILNADLKKLRDDVNPDEDLNNIIVPCGDEVRLLLFARSAREKEDWYRRFVAASNGDVHDQDLHLNNVKLIHSKDLQAAATKAAQLITNPKPRESAFGSGKSSMSEQQRESASPLVEDLLDLSPAVTEKDERDDDSMEFMPDDADAIEGLLMLSSAARNDPHYIKFMALYQNKRTARNENELWKGIDQSLFLGPSGSVVWANVIVGRLLYSVLENEQIMDKIQDILQKKLNSIKLPSFMEDVVIKNIDLGETPPLVHRVSQPMLDERGIWLDMDVTYEGHCHITVTTKLNLLRLKRPMRNPLFVDSKVEASTPSSYIASSLKDELLAANKSSRVGDGSNETEILLKNALAGSAIFDSDAESTGSSSTESENSIGGTMGDNPNTVSEGASNPGNARRIFKFVDRIATSNFFQSATELSFVQKAMENMSTTITLGIDLRGLVSRVTLNIPPPPSDRIWLAFRAPPRLWLTARPTVGDKSVDWSIVTNVIEGKLCEAVNKYLVYPNMVDLTVPFLGKSAASES